jgi:CHAT domain-containing protein
MVRGGADSDQATLSAEAASLYELLIKPVEGMLDRHKTLCIVPDKILNYLPFAALMAAPDKYFVEAREHGFVLSPSSSVFILCSEDARGKEETRAEELLSVGNPQFDPQAFSDLADLQSAVYEAEAITQYYRCPGALTGAAATKRRVMTEMEKSDVIHLATHAVADEWYPLRSKMLLAADPLAARDEERDGVLRAYDIYKLKLARAKLVVLSACGTGVQKYYDGEGMVGLARPFIAKRIPLVVASLWPVNSDSTARLMIDFHRHRKQGGQPAAEALRQAQLDMLRGADGENRLPYHWAPFIAIGGCTSY